jgi:hypothetical protein
MVYHPTGRGIARHLGISPGRVSQLKAAGMPTDTIEAAERWYRANVDQVRSIGNRLSRGAPMPPAPAPDGSAALARAEALGTAAHYALAAGVFDQVEGEMRAALRAVPPADRRRLELPEDVLEALCAEVREDILAHEKPGDAVEGSISAEDAEWLGDFWYSVAAGERGLASR